jgi:hypothetical protein
VVIDGVDRFQTRRYRHRDDDHDSRNDQGLAWDRPARPDHDRHANKRDRSNEQQTWKETPQQHAAGHQGGNHQQ